MFVNRGRYCLLAIIIYHFALTLAFFRLTAALQHRRTAALPFYSLLHLLDLDVINPDRSGDEPVELIGFRPSHPYHATLGMGWGPKGHS